MDCAPDRRKRSCSTCNPCLKRKPHIVIIDGPIGVGKSTLFEELFTKFNGCEDVSFVKEPLSSWRPLLRAYYKGDPIALELQLFVAATFFTKIRNALVEGNPKVIVCDRFLDSGPEVFAQIQLRSGQLTRTERDTICHVAKTYLKYLNLGTKFRFFLEGEPSLLMKNIEKRGRPMEREIEPLYLQEMCTAYTHWQNRLPAREFQILPMGKSWNKSFVASYIQSILLNHHDLALDNVLQGIPDEFSDDST